MREGARAFPPPTMAESVRFFADLVYPLPGVSAVYQRHVETDNTSAIRTVVSQNDFDLRAAVYDAEAATYERFPDERFDFLVVTDESGDEAAGAGLAPQGYRLLGKRN